MKKIERNHIVIASVVLAVIFLIFGVRYFTVNKALAPALDQSINTEISDPEALEISRNSIHSKVTEQNISNNNFNLSMGRAANAYLLNNYDQAIAYYNEALSYKQSDTPYAGMYTIYLNQKNWSKALEMLDKAIAINSVFSDYWKWKIMVMDQGFGASFEDMKAVYEDGYAKIKSDEKVNIVTYFARVSDMRGQKDYAISLWEKAIELNPNMRDVYNAEISNLRK